MQISIAALNSLSHRGPDDQGMWSDEYIQLGHTRLAIIDLSAFGHQPMSYCNERYWITYNGEIYNFLELREELEARGHIFRSRSDTEVLLASYAEWGPGSLEKLRGMFAFAIWDRISKILFLARDRTGEKPLYYRADGDRVYFASELKTLIGILPEVPDLDPSAVDQYFYYQYVPEPLTPLRGVLKLPAAHSMSIDCRKWQFRPQPYWNLKEVRPMQGDPVELLRHELDRSIELTLRSDVPIGIALSGGIDSGAIAALAAPRYKDALHSFSIGYPGRPPDDERAQAEELAANLGLPFHDIELRTEDLVNFLPELVSVCDDPIADIAAYGHYAVMKLAADHGIKVMMSGIGGDELFWGYPWVAKAAELTESKRHLLQHSKIPQWGWHALAYLTKHPFYRMFYQSYLPPRAACKVLGDLHQFIKLMTPQYPKQAVFYDLVFDFKDTTLYGNKFYSKGFSEALERGNAYLPFTADILGSVQTDIQVCEMLFNTWLVSNCLSLSDRVSMASSVETRLPLLDYKLIETVIGIRLNKPDHSFGHKYWLKQVLRSVLPEDVLDRPKRGFKPPVVEWMKGIIHQYHELLIGGSLSRNNVIDPAYVAIMLNEFKSIGKHRSILYKMVLLEIWFRRVVLQETL